MMNRWFTRWLYGLENGAENEPHAHIVREDASPSEPTAYADFPNPDAQMVTLHPVAGGNRVGPLQLAAPAGQGIEKIVDDFSIRASELAKAASSEHRLLYATPRLKNPVHISGLPRVRIKLACDRSAANLSVMLVSLPIVDGAKITDNMITRGWADPQNHKSLTEGEPLVPGQFYELEFELQPDDQVVKAGEQIGLMIFSSDHDFTLWPPPGTELSVDLDATTIDLPVVGGPKALADSFESQ
jgi:X-Pro dipeptidyl-peptidase